MKGRGKDREGERKKTSFDRLFSVGWLRVKMSTFCFVVIGSKVISDTDVSVFAVLSVDYKTNIPWTCTNIGM